MWISLNCCPPSLFIYLAVEWNWLHIVFQLRQPFPQIRGLVFTSISWAPLQAQIFTLTSSLSGTSFQALKWWKIIQIKTAAEAQNRNLHDLYHIWDAVQKLSFFSSLPAVHSSSSVLQWTEISVLLTQLCHLTGQEWKCIISESSGCPCLITLSCPLGKIVNPCLYQGLSLQPLNVAAVFPQFPS